MVQLLDPHQLKQPAQGPAQQGHGVPPQGQHPQKQHVLTNVDQAPFQLLLQPPVAVPVLNANQAAIPLLTGLVPAQDV